MALSNAHFEWHDVCGPKAVFSLMSATACTLYFQSHKVWLLPNN